MRWEKFVRCNKVLDAYLRDKKKAGWEAAVQHKPSISDEDWLKLKEYFADALTSLDIRKVTYFVWFHVTLHFCLQGAEIQCKLRRSDLEFTTIAGEEAIVLRRDFMSKNHRGGLSGSETETSGAITDPQQIAVVRHYLGKLNPKQDRLFQRALYGCTVLDVDKDIWFMNVALGHNCCRFVNVVYQSLCMCY